MIDSQALVGRRATVEGWRAWSAELQQRLVEADAKSMLDGIGVATWAMLPPRLAFVVCVLHGARAAALSAATTSNPPGAWTIELLRAGAGIGVTLAGLHGTSWSVRPSDVEPRFGFTPVEVLLWEPLAPVADALMEWRPEPLDATDRARLAARITYRLERALSRVVALYEAAAEPADFVADLVGVVPVWWDHPAATLLRAVR